MKLKAKRSMTLFMKDIHAFWHVLIMLITYNFYEDLESSLAWHTELFLPLRSTLNKSDWNAVQTGCFLGVSTNLIPRTAV